MNEDALEIKTPWLAYYPEWLPKHFEALKFNNLSDFVIQMCRAYRDRPAYTNFGSTLTFDDIDRKSSILAAYLQQKLGYQKGDRLAIMMPNLLQYPITLYACFKAGIIAVNVNPLYTARELEHQLRDADVRGIVIAENFAHTLADVCAHLPSLKDIIITQFGDELGWGKGMIVNFVVRYIKQLVPNYYFEQSINYKHIFLSSELPFQAPEIDLDDIAVLQYTGGTTGIAKGAMLTHRNLLANIQQVTYWVGKGIDKPGMICITPLPLYHIFCCTVNAMCLPSLGMHNVLITNPRDTKSFVRTLKSYPFSVMTGLNTLFRGLLRSPNFKNLDFSHLRFVVSGGMPLDKGVADEWQNVTGNVIIEGYGLTETSPIVTANLLYNEGFTNGIGYPVSETLVKICDENGMPVETGAIGELWVKGPQVMKGYWRQPQETEESLKDGWFKTGDMATMDARGFCRLVDRKKDMVLVSGFNVYPSEVESVLNAHSDVLESAVIGIPYEKTGEAVKAFVVLKPEKKLTEEELRHYARANLTGYKRPKFYEFRSELPKSNVGKILRRDLMREEREKMQAMATS